MIKSTNREVLEPRGDTEFEVQAYLWNELRRMGVNARGEIKAKYAKRTWVRFDIAIFDNGRLTQIIEIKKGEIKHNTTWEDTRQGKRYNEFGVKVNIVYGMEQAKEFIKSFKENK